ncbi:MAG: NAD(P)/FAD-dependent oxidoreductase [Thermodesulfobacteriota bacterium]|nr:NAD(P)/FAD-dependent oxidoreductase [Thermodesulfobacteriota bacterium]
MTVDQFDTIIIGSGISGMSAGIILAREGEKVLVLEQHDIPGGLTQTFRRSGLVFPTGVHRIGALRPGEPLWYYFNYLDIIDRLEYIPMAEDGFEAYHFPGETFRVPQGHDSYRKKLISLFPNESDAIDRYFKDMVNLVKGIALYNPGCTDAHDRSMEYTGSLEEYFTKIGIRRRLKNILSANNPLFGLPSTQCPVLTHFIITDAYLKSSFRINETATPFSEALAESFQTAGGQIKTRSRMVRFLISAQTVKGVKLESGEEIKTGRVIYSGHPARLPGFCPPKTFRPVYQKRLEGAKNTPGVFGIGLAWKKKNCPVVDNDAYIYDTWDVNDHYHTTKDMKGGNPGVIFLSALPGGKSTCSTAEKKESLAVTGIVPLSAACNEQLTADYGQPGKTTYMRTKTTFANKIMDRIEKTFPGAKENARIVVTYSPATFERYTLTPEGSAYGIKKTAQTFLQAMFNPATRVRGLFLTGQSIGFCGIHGGISASVNLCKTFFPKSYLMDKIRKEGNKRL